MIYRNGDAVRIGDVVYLGDSRRGVIVGIIDDGEYADGYREEDWNYFGHGLIVSTDFGDLRLEEPDEDLESVTHLEPRLRRGL